jgi:hypothetical protein
MDNHEYTGMTINVYIILSTYIFSLFIDLIFSLDRLKIFCHVFIIFKQNIGQMCVSN